MGELLSDFAGWLKDVLLWVPRKLWSELLDGLAALLTAIPTPDFVIQAQAAMGGIPSNVVFFASKFAVPESIAMALAAYAIRFLIRRIPLIG
jgi:hypothetical protein